MNKEPKVKKKPFTIVNVMGTQYKVYVDNEDNNPYLKNASAFVATELKRIYLDETVHQTSLSRTIKHELVHAFLIESGLDIETWANNEEIVDWIALQLDKIYLTAHAAIKDIQSKTQYEDGLLTVKKEADDYGRKEREDTSNPQGRHSKTK